MMAQRSSITSAWENKMWCFSLFNGRTAHKVVLPLPVLFTHGAPIFRPALAIYFAPIKMKFGRNERYAKFGGNLTTHVGDVSEWSVMFSLFCFLFVNAREKYQNLRKWVQSLCAPLRPFRNLEARRNKFYYSILRTHVLYVCTRKKYFATSLEGATKNQRRGSHLRTRNHTPSSLPFCPLPSPLSFPSSLFFSPPKSS